MATILLVEDERNVRQVLRSILEDTGHEVIEACDGTEALAQYRRHQTDLILTDLGMPGQEGLTCIAGIHRAFPNARIAAMTGEAGLLAQPGDARALGVSAVLRKPLDLEELLDVVQGELLDPGRSWQGHLRVPLAHRATAHHH